MTEEKNTNPSRLEVLQQHRPKAKLLDIVRPLLEFDRRSREAGVKVKTHGKEEDAKPLDYLLDDRRRRILETKTPEEIVELGDALLVTRTPLQTFLNNDFYNAQFMQGNSQDLIAMMQELGTDTYAAWDREMLVNEAIPRSRAVIENVGLDQFLRNMRYCAEEGIDLPQALQWGLPVMEDVIITDLQGGNGSKQTAKMKYKGVVRSLESISGVVDDTERQSLIKQLKQRIDDENEQEVQKINSYLLEFGRLNSAISESGLEHQTVYDYLRKEKFETLDQFLGRSRDILSELIEMPNLIANRHYVPFDTLSLEQRAAHTEQGLARYDELAKLIRGEHNFDNLAAEASQEHFGGGAFNIWDNIRGYGRIMGAIFSLVPLSNEEYHTVIEASERYGHKKDSVSDSGFVRVVEARDSATHGIATELRKRQIGKGISIAEIGGTVSDKVMDALGATTAHANGGYRESMFAAAMARSSMDVVENPDELIRLDHYKHRLPDTYDFTVTNKVFDNGSGVGATAIRQESWEPRDSDREGTMELLAVLSNTTRNGGYSVHGGFTIDVPRKYIDYLGFDVIRECGFGQESLTILAKREPKPELFEHGFELSGGRVSYNSEKEEFFLVG